MITSDVMLVYQRDHEASHLPVLSQLNHHATQSGEQKRPQSI